MIAVQLVFGILIAGVVWAALLPPSPEETQDALAYRMVVAPVAVWAALQGFALVSGSPWWVFVAVAAGSAFVGWVVVRRIRPLVTAKVPGVFWLLSGAVGMVCVVTTVFQVVS